MPITKDTFQERKHLRSAVADIRETLTPNADAEPVVKSAEEAVEHAEDMLAVAVEDLESYEEHVDEYSGAGSKSTQEQLQQEVDRWEHKLKSLRWAKRKIEDSSFTDEDTLGEALEALDQDVRRLQRYLGSKKHA